MKSQFLVFIKAARQKEKKKKKQAEQNYKNI